MLDFTNKKIVLGILLAGSLLVHFLFFGHPKQVVFDEVHFGKFISAYSTHEYYFDIHPPLGKLMLAGFGKLFDFKPEFSFAEIGNEFPDDKYKALRFLPSLAGSLLPIVIYLLALELGISPIGAAVVGGLVLFDNALLTQSRFILLDAFLLLFGFSALLAYFKYRNTSNWRYLIATGIGVGLTISIKWTGLTFLALPIILELFGLIRTKRVRHFPQKIATMALVPILLYMTVFAAHFSLLYKSGEGDAFMSQEFQSTLEGSEVDPVEHPPVFMDKFLELNIEMYRSNQRLTADHPYGSQWYTWPLMQRPIFYWIQDTQRIYLLGNPIIWWISTIAVVYLILTLVIDYRHHRAAASVLLLGYILNLLPFIGIKRVMFLYHYLTALIFAILITAYVIDHEREHKRIYVILLLLAVASFVFFAPLTYGTSLSDKAYDLRTWLPTWR